MNKFVLPTIAVLAEIARKEGEVTEHFPLLGNITFSESDIKKLHQYVG